MLYTLDQIREAILAVGLQQREDVIQVTKILTTPVPITTDTLNASGFYLNNGMFEHHTYKMTVGEPSPYSKMRAIFISDHLFCTTDDMRMVDNILTLYSNKI